MTKESIYDIIEILERLQKMRLIDAKHDVSLYDAGFNVGCAAGLKTAVDTIKEYLEDEEGGDI